VYPHLLAEIIIKKAAPEEQNVGRNNKNSPFFSAVGTTLTGFIAINLSCNVKK
jgi:hypothetical protein